MGLELASRLTSGLRGGGDRGDSKAKVETGAGGGTGAVTWTGETETGAVVEVAAGDSGTTVPTPPLPSLASLSWSR